MGPDFRPPEHRGRQYRGQRFIDAIGPPPPPGMGAFLTHSERGESWRVGVFASHDRTVAIGLNFAAFGERTLQIRNALIAAMVLGLLVVAGGGYAVAQRALRPVYGMLRFRLDRRPGRSFCPVVAIQRKVRLLAVPADRRSAGRPRPTSSRSLTSD